MKIVLTPNRSMSWRQNQLVILSLLIISSMIGGGFALMGAWVILPFAGIEILALSASLYYVSWKLSYCHVLNLGDSVTVEKGVYFPKQSWKFSADEIFARVQEAHHDWDAPSVAIVNRSHTIDVGEFLNKNDTLKLIDEIRAGKLRVTYSRQSELHV